MRLLPTGPGDRYVRRQYEPDQIATQGWCWPSTRRSLGRRRLGQDLQAQVPALVADPGQVTEFARWHRQPARNQVPRLAGLQAAQAALGLRPLRLQPHRPPSAWPSTAGSAASRIAWTTHRSQMNTCG